MKPLLVAGLSLALFSCGPSHKSSQAENPNTSSGANSETSKGPASISASPNPVPPGGQLGETTINWDTGSDESGEVYVSENGGPEKRLSMGASGSTPVKWIAAKKRYEFRLYEGADHKKLLGQVQVGGPKK